MMIEGLHHVILISFKKDTPSYIQDEIYNRYQNLDKETGGVDAGIKFWSVNKNLDLRKNIHLVEYAVFANNESFQNFKKHPKHVELVNELLVKYCDWYVGDFIIK